MEKKKPHRLYAFFSSLFIVKVIAITAVIFYSPTFVKEMKSAPRSPASTSTDDCIKAVLDIANAKKLEVDEKAVKKATSTFWKNKNGTFVGATYYKMSKAAFRRIKLTFMDINANFRPIYYIENDEASYAKIFKFIELKSSQEAASDFADVEKEILQWISKYRAYDTDMENMVSEYAALASYVKQLRALKGDDLKYPFQMEISLLVDGVQRPYKDYIGNKEDLEKLIFKLRGKMKSLKGTSYFRFGVIDNREFDQALLAERLKGLESEIRNHLAIHPEQEEVFKELLAQLIVINRDPKYFPTLKFSAKLEFKEMDSEYKDLFKDRQPDLKKLNEFSKKVVENLSPRYQEKLGLTAAKNWVATMKAGRMGVFVGGISAIGSGTGALAIRLWNFINYDKDSEFDIVHAKDEVEFQDNLKKYLRYKFPVEMVVRLEKKNDNEMTLKNLDPKNKKEAELVELVNGIIVERRQFRHEEKLLEDLEKNLSDVIESTGGMVPDEKKPEEKKPKKKLKKTNNDEENTDDSDTEDENDGTGIKPIKDPIKFPISPWSIQKQK